MKILIDNSLKKFVREVERMNINKLTEQTKDIIQPEVMMDNTFCGSPDVKKMNLIRWVESQSDYKKKKKLAMLFRIVAFVVLLICILLPVLLLIGNNTIYKGLLAGIGVGLGFASIPFFIGQSIKIKAFIEFSYPFENIEKEYLKIYEDGIEYFYHNASSDFSESMDIYRIALENINAVIYDKEYHILTIIGEAELLAYDDYAEKRLNPQKSQRKFYSNSPYQILMSFDEEQEIVPLVSKMAKNRTEV